MILTVSPNAIERLSSILEQQAGENEGLRILARGGGCACSGGSFAMGIDAATSDDSVIDLSGVRIIVGPMSAAQLEGAAIDYVEEVMRQGFTIDAPNAAAGGACGCGGH
jgi:iron-sulfur cluster assembly protein